MLVQTAPTQEIKFYAIKAVLAGQKFGAKINTATQQIASQILLDLKCGS